MWVSLTAAFGPLTPPDQAATASCLTIGGRVRGELFRWIRTPSGWYGLVQFHIDGIGGLLRTLVPDAALQPRDDDRTLRGTRDHRTTPTHR